MTTGRLGPRETTSTRAGRIVRAISVLVVLAAAWQLAAALELYSPILLPSPGRVVQAAGQLIRTGVLQQDILVSLWRVTAGFVIAAVFAIPLGILAGWSKTADEIVSPFVEVVRPVPPLAVFPLIILWLGIGDPARIAVITYGCFFAIFVNTVAGVAGVDSSLIRAARSLGASQSQTFVRVVIPAAFPSIVTGLRIGAGLAFFVLVAAELIASDSGLGFLILDSEQRLQSDRVFVGIVTIGILGLLINRGLLAIEEGLVGRRRPSG